MKQQEEEWCHYSNLPSPLAYQDVIDTISPEDEALEDLPTT